MQLGLGPALPQKMHGWNCIPHPYTVHGPPSLPPARTMANFLMDNQDEVMMFVL